MRRLLLALLMSGCGATAGDDPRPPASGGADAAPAGTGGAAVAPSRGGGGMGGGGGFFTMPVPASGGSGGAPQGMVMARDGGLPVPPAMVPSVDGTKPVAPWLHARVGEMKGAAVIFAPGSIDFEVAGGDLVGTKDAFPFAHQKWAGPFDAIAKGDPNSLILAKGAKAGLMVRASLDPGAPFAAVFYVGDNDGKVSVKTLARTEMGGAVKSLGGGAGDSVRIPRIVRNGAKVSLYTGYGYADVSFPTPVTVDLAMPDEAYIGIFASSGAEAEAFANFYELRIHNMSTNPATEGWVVWDVKAVGGTARWSGANLQVSGFGEPSSKISDYGAFALKVTSGDVRLRARITAQTGTAEAARGGLAMRGGSRPESLRDPKSPTAYLALGPAGLEWRSRLEKSDSGGTITLVGPGLKPPLWLQLTKTGATVTAAYSKDGMQWTPVGMSAPKLGDMFAVGVLSMAGSLSQMNHVTLDNLQLGPP